MGAAARATPAAAARAVAERASFVNTP